MNIYKLSLPFNLPTILHGKEWLWLPVPGTIWSVAFHRKIGSRGPFINENAPVKVYRTQSGGCALLNSRIEVDEFGNLIKEVPGWRPNNAMQPLCR